MDADGHKHPLPNAHILAARCMIYLKSRLFNLFEGYTIYLIIKYVSLTNIARFHGNYLDFKYDGLGNKPEILEWQSRGPFWASSVPETRNVQNEALEPYSGQILCPRPEMLKMSFGKLGKLRKL